MQFQYKDVVLSVYSQAAKADFRPNPHSADIVFFSLDSAA